jgi:radical SAM superfamily enzyme YgiQ (UPF0313 family)
MVAQNIVLINLFAEYAAGVNKGTVEPPLGLAYLSSIAKKEGFYCEIIDAGIMEWQPDQVIRKFDADKTLFIGVSINVVTYQAAKILILFLKKELPDLPVVIGGPHVSILPEQCLQETGADLAVIGEAETTFPSIIHYYTGNSENKLSHIKGIGYFEDGHYQQTPDQELIKDLDSIPFPDIEAFKDLNIYRSRARAKPAGVILSSRGCPFQCTYCDKSIFGDDYRVRSVQNILDEIEFQINTFGIKQLDFLDDNLTFRKDHARELFQRIIDRQFNLFINLQNGIRADRLDEPLLQLMKDAGVFKIAFGVESGNKEVLNKAKKGLNLENVLAMTKTAKKKGIIVIGNFMFGLPGETESSLQDTVNFARKMDPHVANFMITIPLPGTELYRFLKDNQSLIVDTKDGLSTGFYAPTVYYRLDTIEPEKIISYYKSAYFKFYFNRHKIWETLRSIRSIHELKWYATTAVDTLKQVITRK